MSDQKEEWPLAGIVERNIQALLQERRAEEGRRKLEDRLADRVTQFAGSLPFVYLHLGIVAFWVGANLGWIPAVKPFDPTFVLLATGASVEAIFLSTFVLISQNRMQRLADRRADLDLQISLLAEHEVTRLLNLTSEIARKLEVTVSNDAELAELKKDVAPEQVLARIDKHTGNP